MIGLLGKKLGMTHSYDAFGRRSAVTVIQAGPCTVVGLREPARHGYAALQLGFEPVAEARLTKPRRGQFAKVSGGPFRYVREFRLPAQPAGTPPKEGEAPMTPWALGQQVTVSVFQPYELVDVRGVSIGKGFQGGMKRWGWSGGPKTHGSMSHRAPGSIGSTTTPGRVWRGHHLPGHMGARRVTVQNMRILRLDAEQHLLMVEGGIPGPDEQLVLITKAVKRPGVIKAPQAVQQVVEQEDEGAKTAKARAKKK